MKIKLMSKTALTTLLSLALVPGPFGNAHAAMITTSQAVSKLNLDANRQNVARYMSRGDVRSELVKFGVDPESASLRVASLSDVEIQNLSSQIDQSTAGGDDLGGVLSLVLVVLLIIYLIQRI